MTPQDAARAQATPCTRGNLPIPNYRRRSLHGGKQQTKFLPTGIAPFSGCVGAQRELLRASLGRIARRPPQLCARLPQFVELRTRKR